MLNRLAAQLGFNRVLLCFGWSAVTAIALLQARGLVASYYHSWPDSAYFVAAAPLLLAVWELPLISFHFYGTTRRRKTALLKGVLWSLGIVASGVFILPPLILLFILFPLSFLISEVWIAFLQWLVLRSLTRRARRWMVIRPIAYLVAMLSVGGLIALRRSPIAMPALWGIQLPSASEALLLGAVGGLIKGIGLVYWVKLPLPGAIAPPSVNSQ